MDSSNLAHLSNLVLYAAMGVLALAMIAFTVHVAFAAGHRRQPAARASERVSERVGEHVAIGVGGRGIGQADSASSGDAAGADGPVTVPGKAAGGGGRELGDRAGGLGVTLSWLGTMLLGASIVARGAAVSRPPFSNMFEFACAASFLVMLLYLVFGLRQPLRWLGLFVVSPVLLVLGLAITVWYTQASELVPSLKSTWLVIHVPVAILSTAVFTISFCVLLLHLAQARREALAGSGRPVRFEGVLATLPDAASLDRTAYSLVVVAFPLWTFTLIAGAIWGQQAWGTYWSWDPKEVWTFVIWVIYAAYLHARATSGWSLRTANIIAVVGYLAIIVNFTIVNYYFPGMHSYSGLVNR